MLQPWYFGCLQHLFQTFQTTVPRRWKSDTVCERGSLHVNTDKLLHCTLLYWPSAETLNQHRHKKYIEALRILKFFHTTISSHLWLKNICNCWHVRVSYNKINYNTEHESAEDQQQQRLPLKQSKKQKQHHLCLGIWTCLKHKVMNEGVSTEHSHPIWLTHSDTNRTIPQPVEHWHTFQTLTSNTHPDYWRVYNGKLWSHCIYYVAV